MNKRFRDIFERFKKKEMEGMIPEYAESGMIEESFAEMLPYLKQAYKLGTSQFSTKEKYK